MPWLLQIIIVIFIVCHYAETFIPSNVFPSEFAFLVSMLTNLCK